MCGGCAEGCGAEGVEEARKGAEGSAEGGSEGKRGACRGCTRGCAAARLVLARRARLRALVRAVDHLVEVELLLGTLHDALLYRAARHQPVQVHHLGLTDAVHARHRLQVDLRVPVRVEEDAAEAIGQARGQPICRGGGTRRRAAGGGRRAAGGKRQAAGGKRQAASGSHSPGVGGLAVDAEAARARGHEEDKPGRAGHVEGVDVDRALHAVGAAVEPAVLVLLRGVDGMLRGEAWGV